MARWRAPTSSSACGRSTATASSPSTTSLSAARPKRTRACCSTGCRPATHTFDAIAHSRGGLRAAQPGRAARQSWRARRPLPARARGAGRDAQRRHAARHAGALGGDRRLARQPAGDVSRQPVHDRRRVRLRGDGLAGRRIWPATCRDCARWTAPASCVAGLQAPPGPPASAYSALVANYHPDAALWQRALDVGVDSFFASANDLVVPSEGGWRTDREGALACARRPHRLLRPRRQPAHRRRRPGHPRQLLRPPGDGRVSRQRARREAAGPGRDRSRRAAAGPPLHRASGAAAAAGGTADRPPWPNRSRRTRPRASPSPVVAAALLPANLQPAQDDVDTFHIVIMDAVRCLTRHGQGRAKRRQSKYARVTGQLRRRPRDDDHAPAHGRDRSRRRCSSDIIGTHERIKAYTNREQGSLPSDDEMMTFGGQLFDTLFQGDVRRLYDEARSRQRGASSTLVLTSMIPWIAEKPWEFAYDAGRKSFLATEEIHFVRNVLTNVPADPIVALRRSAAHPGGLGAAGRFRAAVDRSGGRGHPPRLRAADRGGARRRSTCCRARRRRRCTGICRPAATPSSTSSATASSTRRRAKAA